MKAPEDSVMVVREGSAVLNLKSMKSKTNTSPCLSLKAKVEVLKTAPQARGSHV